MKTLYLIPLLSFVLLTAGCTRGDFWGMKAIIVNKSQSAEDKEKKQAEYTIRFGEGDYANITLIFAEDWGEVGQQVNGVKGSRIVAKQKSVKVENE